MGTHKAAMAFLLSILLASGGIGNICHGRTFRSDFLEEISKVAPVSMAPGDTAFAIATGARDIAVRVEDGCVEHIGYRIFSVDARSGGINPAIADFVERYWLSLTLPLQRQKSVKQQMLEDRFVFNKGSIASIDNIQHNPTMPFSCHSTKNKVTMVWGDEKSPVCQISFPVDHELILGRKMLENDRRLPLEIKSAKVNVRPVQNIPGRSSARMDSVTALWVNQTGSYLDCALRSDRYYTSGPDGESLEPVFDIAFPKESVVNLVTDYDIAKAMNIGLSIRHKTFGLDEQVIETTIPQFVAYCMQNGCIPFAGVISIDEGDSGEADILVIMRNQAVGYNHVLRAKVPLTCISTGKGTVRARLNAFVPSSNIKNLFKN